MNMDRNRNMNMGIRKREPAVRAFFFELIESNYQLSEGEKSPKYVLLPSGIYANRALLVGFLNNVERRENGIKAYMTDPTSDIFFFSGKYTPEVTSFLNNIETPCICALVAKLGTFETPDGAIFISLKPEIIGRADEKAREYWILTTAKETLKRLEQLKEGNVQAAKDAIEHYNTNIERYYNMVFSALRTIASQKAEDQIVQKQEEQKKSDLERVKKEMLDIIKEKDEDMTHEELVKEMGGYEDSIVEEALNALLDDGIIFEPALGHFRLVER
jgi:hypothetical protein